MPKKPNVVSPVLTTSEPEVVKGARFVATVREGWRVAPVDMESERILLVKPGEQPRIVELKTIAEGDVVPRDTDPLFSFPPGLAGH